MGDETLIIPDLTRFEEYVLDSKGIYRPKADTFRASLNFYINGVLTTTGARSLLFTIPTGAAPLVAARCRIISLTIYNGNASANTMVIGTSAVALGTQLYPTIATATLVNTYIDINQLGGGIIVTGSAYALASVATTEIFGTYIVEWEPADE